MAELSAIQIGFAAQLAEAERIVRGTKAKIAKLADAGQPVPSDLSLALVKREAIALTLQRVIINEVPLQ